MSTPRVFVCACRQVHSTSDSDQDDDIPDLIPQEDLEDGGVRGDEDAYYGAYSGKQILQYPDDDIYGGGTTTEYQFEGGCGVNRMHYKSDPTYLGVGEQNSNFFDKSSDQIHILQDGGNHFYSEDSAQWPSRVTISPIGGATM